MGLFEHWPYTNFHELNLDWIIPKMKQISDAADTVEENKNIAVAAAESASSAAEEAANSAESAATSAENAQTTLESFERRVDAFKEYVTPEMFGAVGDGVADDTAALQSAINASVTNKLPVLLKSRVYLTTASIIINDPGVQILGCGPLYNRNAAASRIMYTGQDYAIKISTLRDVNDLAFKDLQIYAENGGGVHFALNRASQTVFENVRFDTYKESVLFNSDGGYNYFIRCKFYPSNKTNGNPYPYISLDGIVTEGIWPNYVYFNECNLEGDNKSIINISIKKAQYIFINNCDICNSTLTGIQLESAEANNVNIMDSVFFNMHSSFKYLVNPQYPILIDNTRISGEKVTEGTVTGGVFVIKNCVIDVTSAYFDTDASVLGSNNIFINDAARISTISDEALNLPFMPKAVTVPAGTSTQTFTIDYYAHGALPYSIKAISTDPDVVVTNTNRTSFKTVAVTVNNTSGASKTVMLIITR